jgi:hypothetical protein
MPTARPALLQVSLLAQSGIEQMGEPDTCFLQLLSDNRVFAAIRKGAAHRQGSEDARWHDSDGLLKPLDGLPCLKNQF